MKLTGTRLTLLVLTVAWQAMQLLARHRDAGRSADEFVQEFVWAIGVCLWTFVVMQALEVVVNGRPTPEATPSPDTKAADQARAGLQQQPVAPPVRRYPQSEADLRAMQQRPDHRGAPPRAD